MILSIKDRLYNYNINGDTDRDVSSEVKKVKILKTWEWEKNEK